MKKSRKQPKPIHEIIIIPLMAWMGWFALFIPMMIYIITLGWDARMPGKGGGWTMAQGFWPIMALALFPLIFTWAFTRHPAPKDYHAVWANKELPLTKNPNDATLPPKPKL